ncbi:MAG: bacteriophage holin [Nitrospiraceae bacterium]|nr:bacteriophage holin [Nitrospiraceae bacterium]
MDLKPFRLGLTLGIIWGGNIFLTTWLSWFTGYGRRFLGIMADLYPGYSVSPAGSFIGLGYGFLDLFIGGLLVGLVYNGLSRR